MNITHYQDIITAKSNNEINTRLEEPTFLYFLSGKMNAIEMKNYQVSVNKRFFFIVEYYADVFGHDLTYYCYDNANDNNNVGFFDIFEYSQFVSVESKIKFTNDFEILEFIPVEWFYKNFDHELLEFINEVISNKILEEKQKQDEKEYLNSLQEKLTALHNSIKSKLTEQEIQSISFLTPSLYSNTLKQFEYNMAKEVSKINQKAKILKINLSSEYKNFKKNNLDTNLSFNQWATTVFQFP